MFCIKDGTHKTSAEQLICEVNPNCDDCNFAHSIGGIIDVLHGKGWAEKECRRLFGLFLSVSPDLYSKKESVSDIINSRYPVKGVK